MDNLPYKVWDRFGELGLLKAGYTIKLGDKKITKKDVK